MSTMVSTIVLFLFGIVFGVQAQMQHSLFGDAEYLKNYVNSVTNDLANFEKSFTFNFFVELSKQKIQRYENVVYGMSSLLRELQEENKQTVVQGKDVSHCYQSAEKYLDGQSKIAFGELDKCMDAQTTLVDPLLFDIRNQLESGRSIHELLNSIVLFCSSGTLVQVAPCVSDRMPIAREAVEKYQLPVNRFREYASSLLYISVENNSRCAGSIIDFFNNKIYETRVTYNKCVTDA